MTISFTTPSSIPFTKIALSKTSIEKACAVVPEFENRIYRFDKKLRMAQYAGRVRRGTFTLPSHRTVLDSLPSHGSSCLIHLLLIISALRI